MPSTSCCRCVVVHSRMMLRFALPHLPTRLVLTAALLLTSTSGAWAACPAAERPASCQPIAALSPMVPGGSVSAAPDVVIRDCRTVPPGTYTFGLVNVIEGGLLYFEDAAGNDGTGTRFYARSILVQKGGAVRAGAWCQPFGAGGGKLTVGLWGPDPSTANLPAIGCKDANGNAAPCYPADRPGRYCTGGDPADPCASATPGAGGKNALFEGYEKAISNPNESLAMHDGTSFGHKVFAVSYGGSLELFGKKGVADVLRVDPASPADRGRQCEIPQPADQNNPRAWASRSGTSWARLDGHAAAGASDLTLDRAVDWSAGDRVVVTTTDWHPGNSELVTLAAGAGATPAKTLKLGNALRVFHQGTTYTIDSAQLSHDPGHANKEVDVRAAVGLLSRSITIRSMGALVDTARGLPVDFPAAATCTTNKPACYFGGHVVTRQGFGKMQLQGVELYQLGQGGRMGSYPVHFHLAKDTSYTNAFVKDSSIWESNTRFVTLHATHGVNVARNVGFLSVGHAFYLEDGSEIGNSLCYNLGVSARAPLVQYFAAQEANSPTQRVIPPILSEVNGGRPFIGADAATPAMFWIMNADNDFVGNKAVGVHGIGVCYWPLNSAVSGASASLSWEDGYAKFNQIGRVAPLRRFRGNSCSTAAYAFMTERGTGFLDPGTLQSLAGLTPVAGASMPASMLPRLDGNFPATKINSGNCTPVLSASEAAACATTVIDHFTTSYNWAEVNVGSVWLRPFHYLFSNSAVTDQLYGGLGFVSGGSPEQALPGQLAITMDSVFVGSTAPKQATEAAAAGPVLQPARCSGAYCSLDKDGITLPVGGFQPKRLVTIYDGPFFADGNVFSVQEPGAAPAGTSVYSRTIQPWDEAKKQMRVVDAGIGWKQPNGFYYPPVFGFRNSGFTAGSTRHNVVDQYVRYAIGNGTAQPAVVPTTQTGGFTPIDTQTILNDLDGTLNGIEPQTGVARSSGLSNNSFYDAPFNVAECDSFGTISLPHEFMTTMIAKLFALPATSAGSCTDGSWTNRKPAVAIYRQYRLPETDGTESCAGKATVCSPDGQKQQCRRGTFFMGSSIGQAIGLTARGGKYYVDTASGRQNGTCLGATNAQFGLAQFERGQTYSIYNLFANSETQATYQIYVGPSFDLASGFRWIRVQPHHACPGQLLPSYTVTPEGAATLPTPTLVNGLLTVTLDQSAIAGGFDYDARDPIRCQPRDLCRPDDARRACVPVPKLPAGYEGLEKQVERICRDWVTPAYAEVKTPTEKGLFLAECPSGGCLGFAFTLPGDFQPLTYDQVGYAASECYPDDSTWRRPMTTADKRGCPVPPAAGRFCKN